MRIKEEFETTLRIKELETTPNSRCVNVMEQVNINGDSSVTDIKFSAHNDPVASSGILSPPTTPSATTPVDNDYSPSTTGSGRFKFFKGINIFSLYIIFRIYMYISYFTCLDLKETCNCDI